MTRANHKYSQTGFIELWIIRLNFGRVPYNQNQPLQIDGVMKADFILTTINVTFFYFLIVKRGDTGKKHYDIKCGFYLSHV